MLTRVVFGDGWSCGLVSLVVGYYDSAKPRIQASQASGQGPNKPSGPAGAPLKTLVDIPSTMLNTSLGIASVTDRGCHFCCRTCHFC